MVTTTSAEAGSAKPNIALICASGLGDAFIQFVLANNLARNGFTVTLYSDFAAQIDSYLENFTAAPFPKPESLIEELKAYDAYLFDNGSKYLKDLPADIMAKLAEGGICYRVSSGKPAYLFDGTGLKQRFADNELETNKAELLCRLNTSIKQQYYGLYRDAVVTQITQFLTNDIALDNITDNTSLNVPRTENYSEKRIVIHPTSSMPRKNWSADKYIHLAKRLSNDGWECVFTVAPNERDEWLKRCADEFQVPLFESIEQLVLYYADSALFVGNDSGNAHVASALGLPTYQIFHRWRTSPPWRAGWGNNKIINAPFPFSLSKKNWQQWLSVDRVYDDFCDWQA